MATPSDIPSEDEALIISIDHFCGDHLEEANNFKIPVSSLIVVTLEALHQVTNFYEIAYRLKNGYAPPENIEDFDVPESERPGIQHINDTIREIQPVCCYLEEESDDEEPRFIEIIAKQANKSDNF